ncbi:MAG: AAA family ATPase [Acidimicrobiaceae bacterium]|nr:AAA family ATPase [Acidimicrobiaceae bacterium]
MSRPGSNSLGLLDRSLVFITGKGGVGKSSVTAALGLLAAKAGKRTLICEVDAKGDVARLLDSEPIGFEATEVRENLLLMSMNTEEALREYLRIYLRLPVVAKLGPLAKTFDFVANAAPGVQEILVVGKLCYEVKEAKYDLILVDATSTGHIVSQLASPKGISELVRLGMVKDQVAWMEDILYDSSQTSVIVVATPAETPINEALELANRIDNETDVHLSALVVNKVMSELFSKSEEEFFISLQDPKATRVFNRVISNDVGLLLRGSNAALEMRRCAAPYVERLVASAGTVPVALLPLMFGVGSGMRLVRDLGEALAAEWDELLWQG